MKLDGVSGESSLHSPDLAIMAMVGGVLSRALTRCFAMAGATLGKPPPTMQALGIGEKQEEPGTACPKASSARYVGWFFVLKRAQFFKRQPSRMVEFPEAPTVLKRPLGWVVSCVEAPPVD